MQWLGNFIKSIVFRGINNDVVVKLLFKWGNLFTERCIFGVKSPEIKMWISGIHSYWLYLNFAINFIKSIVHVLRRFTNVVVIKYLIWGKLLAEYHIFGVKSPKIQIKVRISGIRSHWLWKCNYFHQINYTCQNYPTVW